MSNFENLSKEALKLQNTLNSFVFNDNITTAYLPAVIEDAGRYYASISFTFSALSMRDICIDEVRPSLQRFCSREGMSFSRLEKIAICLDPLVYKLQATFTLA